jgi:penicillin-binding protein 2
MFAFLKKRKFKKLQQASWVEDSFTFENGVGRQVALPQSDQFFGRSTSNKSIFYLFLFFCFAFILLWSRLVHLQLVQGAYYRERADINSERIVSIPSERGIIYDRNDIPLTQNIPSFSLAISPQDLSRKSEELSRVAKRLAELTGKPEQEISSTLNDFRSNKNKYRSLIIQENLDYDTALNFQVEASDLPGIHIERGSKRLYYESYSPNWTPLLEKNATTTVSSLSHVLGYLAKVSPSELSTLETKGYLLSDSIGKNGIEKFYEEYLRGIYGKRRVEVDTSGRQQVVLSEEAPKPGNHVILSLDLKIQSKLEEIMKANLAKFNKQKAIAVAMNPNTGEILAMVSLPSFNNNDFSGGITQANYSKYIEDKDLPLFNRAISGTYPSGSTIKPAVAAAALQEGIITPNTTVRSSGGIQVGPWFFPDWKAGGHGITDVRKSLAESVNTFYYTIGGGNGNITGLGVDKIDSYLKLFGISSELGIDVPGEASGFLPSKKWKEETKKERWYIGDTYNLSIGQGDLLVTPLQIASLTATVANGGTLYQPHLLKALMDPISKKETPFENKIIRKDFIDSQYFSTIRLGMRDCVLAGSCRRLSTLPFAVAAKTGTAQWNSNKENHAWFTSFAPFEKPEIVLTVLVEEGREGSETAAPIAYDFYKWWGSYHPVDKEI